MDQDLMRIGISLPDNLLGRFDEIITKRGYSSRSEGVRDAIRNYILQYEWMSEVGGERIGILSIIYDHDQRGVVNNLIDLQHDNSSLVNSSLHLHLDDHNCLEILMLRGEGKAVTEFSEKIMALKGVKHIKLTTIKPGVEI
ncbi:MAG TPA: nickel-responsive transcriptional regulator NikR [Methanocella sp.]|nr:nickel-responsive transcriptional regulator NikR [Methanocella sp.]